MALFRMGADDAVQAGIARLKTITEYNITRTTPERPPLQMGIGINTGKLMLGTVGGNFRMDGTVGDTVNLASPIEGLTKSYGVSLLISDRTFLALEEPIHYHLRSLDLVKVKGKSEKVSVFEVFDADPPQLRDGKLKTKTKFEQAFVFLTLAKIYLCHSNFHRLLAAKSGRSHGKNLPRSLSKAIVN